jgi:hypothetical protein
MTRKITLDFKKIATITENSVKIQEWFKYSKKPFPKLSKV